MENKLLQRGTILLLFLMGAAMSLLHPLSAQNPMGVLVKGLVKDVEGEPIIGATVQVKEGTAATITSLDGTFQLNMSPNGKLVISYIGYSTAEVSLDGKRELVIVLKEDSKLLDEVVVVGYGTLEKKQVTSSITSVSGKDLIQGVGGSSIANALQGKVPGLVISGSGSPNSGNTLQLRGVSSVKSGKTPLIVIDGMPSGDIRSVIQEDILSIDVLKDASAGAIYGTRAAAGVILITTKQAKESDGKTRVNYTGEFTRKQATHKPDMLSAKEYLAHGRGTDYGSSVSWWDELINKNNFSQKHIINTTAGNKSSQIYTSFMYSTDEGIAVEDTRKDYAGRVNANFKLLDGWLEVKTITDYRQALRNNNAPNFRQAMRNNPTRSPYDPDNETGYNIWLGDTDDYNVLADSKTFTYEGLDKWFKPGAIFKLNVLPVPGLSYQQTVGYENRQWELHTYQSKWNRNEQEQNRNGSAYLEFSKTEILSTEGYASYVGDFGKHGLNAVGGYSYYEKNNESFNMKNYDFTSDLIGVWDIGEGSYLADGKASMGSNKGITERLLAFFARANYSYDDKYMLMATLRREGSSKFAKNNRWGNFWSVSGGWNLAKENFMEEIGWVDNLKLRVGYGVTGNNNFSSNLAATMYGKDHAWMMPDGSWSYSYGKTKIINKDLKWEEKTEWNLGLDYSFLNNRIYGKVDLYRRKVNDMLYEIVVPTPPYIKNKMYKNIGNLENKGWEFEIGADVVRSGNWKYSTTLNLSHNKTKILNLDGNDTYFEEAGFPSPGNPGNAIRIKDGVTLGSFYIWKFAGFDDEGKFMVYNKDGEVISADKKTAEDKRYVGNYMPKVIMAWNHNLSYKNWDMTVNMRSWIDFDIYNQMDMYFGLKSEKGFNVLKKAYGKYDHITDGKQLCDYFLQDGTFLKIDAINIGYNMDLKKYWKSLEKARFYLTMTNVATFTRYKGLNPEVDITGFDAGIERVSGAYPQSRNYTLGIQISF